MKNNFDGNTLLYILGLIGLFIGLYMQFGLATALIVIGGLLIAISVATSFFMTWLSTRVRSK